MFTLVNLSGILNPKWHRASVRFENACVPLQSRIVRVCILYSSAKTQLMFVISNKHQGTVMFINAFILVGLCASFLTFFYAHNLIGWKTLMNVTVDPMNRFIIRRIINIYYLASIYIYIYIYIYIQSIRNH